MGAVVATVALMADGAAGEERMRTGVARTYATDRIEVTWEPSLCIHSTRCFRGLPEVFDPRVRPWVRPEAADAEAVAEVIDRCPSRALKYRWLADGPTSRVPE
jgi:uncharacterized Fe-S cluster protein YjdI